LLNLREITLEEENKLLSNNTGVASATLSKYLYKALCYQRSESRNKKSESKIDAEL
jgi:hypothetical protein